MADIFISYSREDRALIEPIADMLEKQGYKVWWDSVLNPGQQWDAEIKLQLNNASRVIVAWSRTSIQSNWVKAEADAAERDGKLIPILIEQVEPPLQFRLIQTQDFTSWNGLTDEVPARKLLNAMPSLLKNKNEPLSATKSSTKLAVIAAIFTFLFAAILPSIMIYMEHGKSILMRVIEIRPHYFIFNLLFLPAAVGFLVKSMMNSWFHQITRNGRWIYLIIFTTLGLCVVLLDDQLGNITYFEITKDALAQHPELKEHLIKPAKVGSSTNYTKQLTELAKTDRAWHVLFPYYIGNMMQFSYWIFFVATLGLISFSQAKTSYSAAISILVSGSIASFWLPLHSQFLATKLVLYDEPTLTSAVWLGIIILGFLLLSTKLISDRYTKFNITRYGAYSALFISVMIFVILAIKMGIFLKADIKELGTVVTVLVFILIFGLIYINPLLSPSALRKR